jgi:Na+/H+ antiporter NhaD/arsenite permease-like protein
MVPAIILFAATYVLMLTFSKYRPYIALGSAVIFIVSGMLPLNQILPNLDFNVLLMIAGTMGLVQLFIDSKMPSLMADVIMEKVPNVQMAAVSLALFAGIISAFVDNVATVLMVAPVAIEICRKLKTNPIPFIIGIGILRKEGCDVKNADFFKIGIPFTLAAIIPAYIYLWLFYGM